MRLIAYWTDRQNPETDPPSAVRWDNGATASMQDFTRILGDTQSEPHVQYSRDGRVLGVEFSYEVEEQN